MDLFKEDMNMSELCANKAHDWKSRIHMVLSLKEIDEYIEDDPLAYNSEEYRKWSCSNNKAKATIKLAIFESHLEQV